MSSSMGMEDLGGPLSMTVDDMTRIAQSQVLNPNSQIYISIRDSISAKIASLKAISDADKRKRKKNRVYISAPVDSGTKYQISNQFPHWDIRFTNNLFKSAPRANASVQLATEYLFDKFKSDKGSIVAFGIDARAVIMRSRSWVHFCVPSSQMQSQYEFFKQDRDIMAVWNNARSQGKQSNVAKQYAMKEYAYHCSRPEHCIKYAKAGIMMLHKTDTNFRQVCVYMRQHGIKLLYYAIPYNHNLEFGTTGEFPALDAYVTSRESGKYVDIVYAGDYSLNMTYTYSNYLELLARTEYRLNGRIYRKEFDNYYMGMACYKVTSFEDDGDIMPSPTLYRSWYNPDYKDKYLMYSPVLKDNGSAAKARDWELSAFFIDKRLVDEVHDAAMRAQGVDDIMDYILKRLNSSTMSRIVLNQVLQNNTVMPVSKLELVAHNIYSSVFMQKFLAGKAVSTLAPKARYVGNLSKTGVLGLLFAYTSAFANDITTPVSQLAGKIRNMYYDANSKNDLPMPTFMIAPGYVEYNGEAGGNPRFKSWDTPTGLPNYGFYSALPGGNFRNVGHIPPVDQMIAKVVPDVPTFKIDYHSILSGLELVEDIPRTYDISEDPKDIQIQPMSTWREYFTAAFDSVKDFYDVEGIQQMLNSEERADNELQIRMRASNTIEIDMNDRFQSDRPGVRDLVEKVTNANNNLSTVKGDRTVQMAFVPEYNHVEIPGLLSVAPATDLVDGLNSIFPESALMNTTFFESDKLYGDLELNIKGNKLKIDLSKLSPLKPESFFLPSSGTAHLFPHAKGNTINVLKTLEKRNANTPDNTIPMDDDLLFEKSFAAYLKVFCKEGAADRVMEFEHNYIGPDEEAVLEWVSRLDEAKSKKLLSQEGFSLNEIDLSKNNLILKGKVKPDLSAGYATSVKMPQSIQYDPSGKSTAVLSPVIARKVEREQTILKHNVLVMQRKSLDDVNKFLNQFDWRPDERGQRMYLEGDYSYFDKTIGARASQLHWRKAAKFGVLPDIVKFLEQHNRARSVSSVEAGVKMFLDTQRGSGHPDTLDGNNDVNQLAISELLLEIQDIIEFIIIQGDDFIVAIRGNIANLYNWEQEIARKFNLSIKLDVHEIGYILSYHIVHLPEGNTLAVPDVIKKSLSLMSANIKDEDKFIEYYQSFVDNMRHVGDAKVQDFLANNLVNRYAKTLPGVNARSINLLTSSLNAFKQSFKVYREFYSPTKHLRSY